AAPAKAVTAAATEEAAPATIVVPAGTKVPLVLKQAVSSKNAQVGDNLYLETNFPVVQNNRMVIPPGTYVQGVVAAVKRPGRIKGRAELLVHFTTMIFPNGYTVSFPGALDNVPGAESQKVKDKEGTIQADSQKGKDIATVASTSATGTLVGGLRGGGKGAGIGAGVGGATGLIIAMLTRGNEVRLESGTGMEMVLERPLTLEEVQLNRPARELVPMDKDKNRRLERPVLTPPPDTH
ncbi:MAG: TrbI/VirB10 family protein, partial [Acidobacteriota bacterium]|nr:TrbI/VirB10 family protein [Acidobacteriota bacterium]